MDIWDELKKLVGYQSGNGGVDSYGVDHNNFCLRDEIEYQINRVNNEEKQSMISQQTPTPWKEALQQQAPQSSTPTPWRNEPRYASSGNTGTSQLSSAENNSIQPQQTPTPWNNAEQQSPQSSTPTPWRNHQTVTPWAGGYDLSAPAQNNGNYISDEDLYARMWENIKEQEGVISHPYLDTKGLITIGGGANVNDWNVFKNLNVTVNRIPATEAQKWEAYQKLRQMSDAKDANGNYVNRNTEADKFEDKTNIRISDAEARGLAQNHMNNDLAHLRGEFSDFDSFPLPLKEVLLDIQYNVRGGVNSNDWPNLYRAIRNRDIGGIVENVNRKDVQQSRNDWAKRTARSIRF